MNASDQDFSAAREVGFYDRFSYSLNLSADDQLDPLWSGQFPAGVPGPWMSYAVALQRDTAGIEKLARSDKFWTPERALAFLMSGQSESRKEKLSALAALRMWGTLTGPQVAAFAGKTTNKRQRDLGHVLWVAGLAERCIPVSETRMASMPRLYRLMRGKPLDRVLKNLTHVEFQAVTLGQKVTRCIGHELHSVLNATLALRIDNICAVPGLFGKSVCDQTVFSAPGRVPRNLGTADMVIVRNDGLRIIVDLVSTARDNWSEVLRRWKYLLANFPRDTEPGWIVLFVEADRPEHRRPDDVWNGMLHDIAQEVNHNSRWPERPFDERFAVVRWRWWFPEPGVCESGFSTLRALCPTGPASNRWEPVDLLDPSDLRIHPTDRHRDVLSRVADAWGALSPPADTDMAKATAPIVGARSIDLARILDPFADSRDPEWRDPADQIVPDEISPWD